MKVTKQFLYTVVVLILSNAKPSVSPTPTTELYGEGPVGNLYFLNKRDGSGSTFAEIPIPGGNGTYIDAGISIAIDFDFLPSENLFLFVSETTLFSWDPKTNNIDGPILNVIESGLFFNGIEVDQSRSHIYLQFDNTTDGTWSIGRMDGLDSPLQTHPTAVKPKGGSSASFELMAEHNHMLVPAEDGIEVALLAFTTFFVGFGPSPIVKHAGSQVTALNHRPEDATVYYSLNQDQSDRIFCYDFYNSRPCPANNQPANLAFDVGMIGFYGGYFFPSVLLQGAQNPAPFLFQLFNISTGTAEGLDFVAFDTELETQINIANFLFIEGPSLREDLTNGKEHAEEEFNILIRPAAIRFRNSRRVVLQQEFPEGYTVSFKRAASTGKLRGLPADVDQTDARVVLNALRRNPRDAVGVYTHEFHTNGDGEDGGETIQSVLQWAGKLRFTDATQTVFESDRLVLSTPLKRGRNRRWRFNGKLLRRWNGRPSLTIPNVMKSNAGIYENHLIGRRSRAAHGIVRVIVAACPKNRYNAPSCDETTSLECYNGGILRSDRDKCICAPGFMGEECEIPYGDGAYGQQGQFECSGGSCSGVMICLPDPYGCSCAAGYHGPNCDLPCRATTYGASCRGICHCGSGGLGACDPYTGECINDVCSSGFTGVNCQKGTIE